MLNFLATAVASASLMPRERMRPLTQRRMTCVMPSSVSLSAVIFPPLRRRRNTGVPAAIPPAIIHAATCWRTLAEAQTSVSAASWLVLELSRLITTPSAVISMKPFPTPGSDSEVPKGTHRKKEAAAFSLGNKKGQQLPALAGVEKTQGGGVALLVGVWIAGQKIG